MLPPLHQAMSSMASPHLHLQASYQCPSLGPLTSACGISGLHLPAMAASDWPAALPLPQILSIPALPDLCLQPFTSIPYLPLCLQHLYPSENPGHLSSTQCLPEALPQHSQRVGRWHSRPPECHQHPHSPSSLPADGAGGPPSPPGPPPVSSHRRESVQQYPSACSGWSSPG